MDLLAGVHVLSFNHFLAGPAGAQVLADLGADVIAVEPLEGAFQRNWAVAGRFVDGQSVNHLTTGRNKRSLAVNLKSEAGVAVVRRLLERADVVMENFRPGTMDKLGLGYEAVAALNPRVIYASATGFGADGPYRDRPGQDLLVQALSGLAARTGDADGPPTPVGPTVVDQHAAMVYAMAILAALFARERTGRGRRVEVDLLSAALDLQTESLTCYLNGGDLGTPRAPGNIAAWFSAAPYGIYATQDGHLALSLTPLATLAEALELPELKHLPESEALSRRAEIAAQIAERLATRPTAHWLGPLEAHRVWHAKVQDYDEVMEDPQIRHNGSLRRMPGATGTPVGMVMHPARYDGQAPEVRLAPQPLGAQTREILAEISYDEAEIGTLEAAGAVRSAAPAREG